MAFFEGAVTGRQGERLGCPVLCVLCLLMSENQTLHGAQGIIDNFQCLNRIVVIGSLLQLLLVQSHNSRPERLDSSNIVFGFLDGVRPLRKRIKIEMSLKIGSSQLMHDLQCHRWMDGATSSLPVPVSPEINTVESVPATCWMAPATRCMQSLRPTSPPWPGSSRTASRRYSASWVRRWIWRSAS